jgi:hypothetical protein
MGYIKLSNREGLDTVKNKFDVDRIIGLLLFVSVCAVIALVLT